MVSVRSRLCLSLYYACVCICVREFTPPSSIYSHGALLAERTVAVDRLIDKSWPRYLSELAGQITAQGCPGGGGGVALSEEDVPTLCDPPLPLSGLV